MRINKYIAQSTELSRRAADAAVLAGRVTINGRTAVAGDNAETNDRVTLDNRAITPVVKTITIMLNKPVGYVVSKDGQGSKTVYDLLPREYQQLNPVGRLDKYSSGLLLFTNDGSLANELTHPSKQKDKVYEVSLHKPLAVADKKAIDKGVPVEDYVSSFSLKQVGTSGLDWIVTMHMGKNRQIRRTFSELDYTVTNLHRTHFGPYFLDRLSSGKCIQV